MKFDLEDRLINFAVLILDISESLPELKGSTHLAGQLMRSGTAPALQYGEAQSAESRKDFIHKMKIALKELRETMICLKILARKDYLKSPEFLAKALTGKH
jgi:four helix bundle protein